MGDILSRTSALIVERGRNQRTLRDFLQWTSGGSIGGKQRGGGDLSVKIVKHKKVRAKYLVTGLPGVGRVGHVAALYILSKLNPEKVATLYASSFPPHVIVQRGFMRPILNDFFYVDAEKPFILLTGDSQPMGNTPEQYYEYVDAILRYAKEVGVKEIYAMAGIPRQDRFTRKPGVYVAATDEDMLKALKKLGAKVDEEGLIVGAAGLLPAIGALRGFKGACLMGETATGLTERGDPGAALAVLKIIRKLFGLEIDLTDLEKAESQLENAFSKFLKSIMQAQPERKGREEYIR